MTAGPFDFSGVTSAWLIWDHYLNMEEDWDLFRVLVSLDDSSYHGYMWTRASDAWESWSINLATVADGSGGYLPVLGASQVWVAFVFESDTTVTGEGAYVDQVEVVTESGAPPGAPAASGVTRWAGSTESSAGSFFVKPVYGRSLDTAPLR